MLDEVLDAAVKVLADGGITAFRQFPAKRKQWLYLISDFLQ